MKAWKWIKWVLRVVVVLLLGILFTSHIAQSKHIKSLKNHVQKQSTVIDSLLNRRMTVMDVQLYVTDKSKNTIYGRYNKGTISMPQEKIYKLEVDSVRLDFK